MTMNNTETNPRIKRPTQRMHFTEVFRAISDYRKSKSFLKSFNFNAQGDGHPVLVIPGFMGSETSTKLLRKFIDKLGYQSHDWGLGRNLGDIKELEILQYKIDHLHLKSQEKVSLIGWSLGGVYARELAKSRPDKVRQVITLGSPFSGIMEPNNASWLFHLIRRNKAKSFDPAWIASLVDPAPVPTTAVYSKEDGIVPWKVCLEQMEDDLHQNVEIKGAHTALANNASTLLLVADRLRYDAENWKRFEYGGELRELVDFPGF